MKEEQIEKAARDLCTTDRQEQWLKDFGTTCFADGARWRIEAAWHDRTDTPHGFALILSENADVRIRRNTSQRAHACIAARRVARP